MNKYGRNRQRMLRAEQLENRELLAADFCCLGTAIPPDAGQLDDVALVPERSQVRAEEVRETLLQVRDRMRQECESGESAQQRARDRDCENLPVTESTSLAVADPTADEVQPKSRQRTDEDSETGTGWQKRPRDRDSEDDVITVDASVEISAVDAVFEAAAVSGNGAGGGGQQDPTTSQISAEEAEDIIFIREEEKLARDVYVTLGLTWDTPIFDNIAASEATHMASVKTLIDKYDLVDPVTTDKVGEFTNPVLQELYEQLVSGDENIDLGDLGIDVVIDGGAVSQLAAYKVGAFIEEFDILDIQHALVDVNQSDIQNVYENLLQGSRNHLRSFVAQIEAIEGTYQPVLMSGVDPVTGLDLDAQYAEIIAGDQETGNGNGRGGRRR